MNSEQLTTGGIVLAYRKAELADIEAVSQLMLALWPEENTLENFRVENERNLTSRTAAVYLALDGVEAVGFAIAELRYDYVEGTEGGNVGYLEGIYVAPGYRRMGAARRLAALCENWARTMGCREFGSDCELDNEESCRFHLAIGFAEANRLICFVKRL